MTFSTLRSSTVRECVWFSTSPSNGISFSFSSCVSLVVSLSILDIQVLYEFCTRLNKVLTQLHLCSHEFVKNSVRLLGVFYFYLHQDTLFGVHSCFKKLFGIHFTQSLVAFLLDKTSLTISFVFAVYLYVLRFTSRNHFIENYFQLIFVIDKYARLSTRLHKLKQWRLSQIDMTAVDDGLHETEEKR